MMHSIYIYVCFVTIAVMHMYCGAAQTVVHTSIGTIEGFQDTVQLSGHNKSVLKFLGIPYAETTAGNNRFKKPVPKAPFKTVFQAKTMAPRCYEGNSDRGSIASTGYTEDCLYLNIVVPGNATNTSSLPVMLFIHGGALDYGASSEYIADALVAFGNVIVVTINYRLGVFGFLRSKDGALIGNQGLWDQHLAIKWVHTHIASFYGDPDRITIFGESAGSESVTHQAMYAGNQGLFKRVIAESGSAVSYWTLDKPNAEDIFQRAGCSQNAFTDRVACLEAKPAADLAVISNEIVPAAVVDGDFILERPKSIVYGNSISTQNARDVFASVDIMIGVNSLDGGLDLPYYWADKYGFSDIDSFNISWQQLVDKMIPEIVDWMFPYVKSNTTRKLLEQEVAFEYKNWQSPSDPEYARNTVIDMTSHFSYFGPTVDTVRAHSRLNKGRTYMYEFSMLPSNHETSTPVWRKGASHGDELPFVFGEPVSSVGSAWTQGFTYTKDEEMAAYAVMSMWTNFAKTGNPNSPMDISQYSNVTWPQYDESSQRYLKMSSPYSSTSVEQRLDARKLAFWIDYMPQLAMELEKHFNTKFNPSTGLVG